MNEPMIQLCPMCQTGADITADAEFALSKREYLQITGRRQERDVIAYQIRQSFKPGEITPEEANAIGYEFAKRFTKENHAFIVCTHIDKAHIHNHIIWNSTSIDCTRKFRNFWGSTRAVRKLSDLICIEHELSIVENPKLHGKSYNSRFDDCKKKSIRDYLRQDIDEALSEKPKTFEDFIMLLSEKGYRVKKGKNISVSHARQKRYIRFSSLGSGYSEAEIRAAIFGNRKPKIRKKNIAAPIKPTLLSEIQNKLHSGKGAGYDRWASVFKAKQMAKTILYLQENGISSLDEVSQKSVALKSRYAELSQGIKQREKRLAEIAVLRIVAPLTSNIYKKRNLPTHHYLEEGFLPYPSIVQLEQITTIDKRQAKKFMGRVARSEMEEIEECIEKSLGLYIPEEMEAP